MVIPLEKVALPQPPPTQPPTNKKEETNESSSLTLLDLISKMQEKLITASTTINKTPVQHILSNLTANTKPITQQQQSSENLKDYIYIENIHENINYNMWVIKTAASASVNSTPLRILVRTSISGYVNTESSSRSSIVLHTKLEYQSQFGCEKLSHKDYCFMWAKSYLRNCCDVLLCRINVFTNKLISCKTISYKEILTGYANFNCQQELYRLKCFLDRFNKLFFSFFSFYFAFLPNFSQFKIRSGKLFDKQRAK
jgi:hypothetical protein